MKIGESIQQILTQGLDAAAQIRLAELRVNDPATSVTGPNGERVTVGQSAGFAGVVGSVPPWLWIAGLAVIAGVVLIPLLRR